MNTITTIVAVSSILFHIRAIFDLLLSSLFSIAVVQLHTYIIVRRNIFVNWFWKGYRSSP